MGLKFTKNDNNKIRLELDVKRVVNIKPIGFLKRNLGNLRK